MRTVFAISLLALSIAAVGCKKAVVITHPAFPGTADGAKALLAEFVKPGANLAPLTQGLRAEPADYAAVFTPDAAAKIQKVMETAWTNGQFLVRPAHPNQTEMLVLSATTDELKAGSPNCPGGYKDAAPQMTAGLTVYCFKFVEPGSKTGTAFDGLIFVNGHWAIFPKPWFALKNP
ncbi:MAG: hypothetical protein ABJE95_24645 [Byssovorax sp.]